MYIFPWFNHPQAIPGVYDFVLSDKYTQLYYKMSWFLQAF